MKACLLFAFTVIFMASGTASAKHPLLTDHSDNKDWYAPANSEEAVYIGTPTDQGLNIELRKGPMAAAPLAMSITTDAEKLILKSADQSIELAIEPGLPNKLTLNGNKLRPRILAGGQELSALRGAWVKMFVLSEHTTLTIHFPKATYANVEFIDHGHWNFESDTSADLGHTPRTAPWEADTRPLPPEGVSMASSPDPAGTVIEHMYTKPPVVGKRSMEPTYQDKSYDPNVWSLSLDGGVSGTTAYFYRGIGQENQDIIIQSNLEAVMRVWRSFGTDDVLNYLDLFMGLTNSHHWGPTGRDGPGEKWFEIDIAGGARIGVADRWEFEIGYVNRSAPSDQFTDVHQVEFGVLYNDADPNYSFQLWPHLLVSAEFDEGSDATNVFSESTDEGIYLELGIRPEFELFHLGPDTPVMLVVPATIGLSVNDYYEAPDGDDETFGFLDVGLEFSIPAFQAAAEGGRQYAFRWEAGVHFLLLGDTAEELSDFYGTGGDSLEIIGSIGISVDH